MEITNQSLKLQQEQLNADIKAKNETIHGYDDTIASLNETKKKLRQEAEEQVKEYYEARMEAAKKQAAAAEKSLDDDYEQKSAVLILKLEEEKKKIKELEDKQRAYIEARKRQEQIEANSDYYRLALDDLEVSDINLLRKIQVNMVKKDAIDKLIWEMYFKPAFDVLSSHLFNGTTKKCGIYKITDLTTGLPYIGQSVDIRERWRQHVKTSLTYGKSSNKLYQTMQQSGQHNFTFEILEEVPRDKLNEREVYWIEFYQTKESGLNSTRGGA